METFNYAPNWGITLNQEPEVHRLSFGDGYEQVSPKGLNHNLRTYSLMFSGTEAHIKQILTFLDRHGGYKAFLWIPQDGKQGKFRCDKWQVTLNSGYWHLSAEFREVVM